MRGGAVQPVQGPGQSIAGQLPRQGYPSGQLWHGRGVEEGQPLLLQGPENAAQPAGCVALMAGEFTLDVIGGDLPQVRPGRCSEVRVGQAMRR